MLINLNKNSNLSIELKRKYKKYLFNIKINSKYLNYEIYNKIQYEYLITIIENIENMIFCKYRCAYDIDLKKLRLEFNQAETTIKFVVKINDEQEYSIILNREHVLELYNYLANSIKTFNKIQQINFCQKYTYVKVRYIDVYSSGRYSYISDDKNIKVGDIVYVDRSGEKCLAVVEDKNEYYYEQAPYPVLATKRVIKIVTKAEKYKV